MSVTKRDKWGEYQISSSPGGIPRVSVVMGVWNGDSFLRESVASILNQKFEKFEFIIVNDGSTDKTGEILEELQSEDSRIIVIEQEHLGLTTALNRAIALAQGDYVARQDVDDISHPERL